MYGNKTTRELLKIEAKTTSAITPKGDKQFSLKKSVLDQAKREAEEVGAIAALWLHWNNGSHERDDYAIVPTNHFIELVRLARIGLDTENDLDSN